MYETVQLPTRAQSLFNLLLWLYPKSYRKRFGQEMLFVFQDAYNEELARNGKVGLMFWLAQVKDIFESVIGEHMDEVGKKGMKKYLQQTLHINRYNVIGGILLLPIFSVFIIDLIARIIQRDLVHYNRPVYAFLSHTIFYQFPIQFVWVILFPLFAVVFNLIPLFSNAQRTNFKITNATYLKRNLLSILFLAFGLFFILLIRFHDFAPCVFQGLTHFGVEQLNHIISFCRSA